MIFIGIALLVYILYSVWIIAKIHKSKLLNTPQKVINSILVIFIPYFWGLIVSFIIKPSETGFVDHSEEIEKERNTKFYESGVGIRGGGGWSEHINDREQPIYYDEHGNKIK